MRQDRPSRPAVRRASPADLPAVRRTLVSGFAADPLYCWLYPEPASRPALMDEVFRFVIDAALPRDAVWVLDDLSAAAVWTPPGVDLVDEATGTAYAALLERQIGAARAAPAVEGMVACARHEPTGPHAVLHNIAVRGDRQGTGAGSVLLAGSSPGPARRCPCTWTRATPATRPSTVGTASSPSHARRSLAADRS